MIKPSERPYEKVKTINERKLGKYVGMLSKKHDLFQDQGCTLKPDISHVSI